MQYYDTYTYSMYVLRTPGKGFEPLCAEAQPLPCFDLEAVAVPLG